MTIQCFDIHSTKEKQYGFRAELPRSVSPASASDGVPASPLVVACLGDEPYNPANRPLVEQADWLMAEAFCLYADRETFKPYEKSHSTALDAGRLASQLGVRHLILYHTEEKTLATRKVAYAQEAAQQYDGPVLVPDDLEVIPLD